MLQVKINISVKSFRRIFLGLNFILLISANIGLAQVKKINLVDSDNSSGAGTYNLYQSYKLKKGKLNSYCYIPFSFDGTSRFGRTSSFYAEPSKKVPFSYIKTSLDNSTIIGKVKDTIYVYDIASEQTVNSFIVENSNNWTLLSNDGSFVFVKVNKRNNRNIKIVDTNTGEVIKEIPLAPSGGLRISPDNHYLALNMESSIHVYDLWEGGEALIYNTERINKKKQKTSEFILDVEVTSDGLVAMSYVLKGEIKKKHVRIQHFAVVNPKTGRRLCNVRSPNTKKTSYSLDPTGKVLYAGGKFYDVKTGDEIEVNHKNKKKPFSKLESWKFHPHIQGVYHALYGKGVNGSYSFE